MTRHNFGKQAGVALVTAIFLLVALAGLAVAVVSLTTAQQSNAVKDEMGVRGYQAAKAGIQWALFTALQNAGVGLGFCAAPVTFALPEGTTLSSFTVTVTCSNPSAGYGDQTHPETDPTAGKRRISATACNGPRGDACPAVNPGPDYVQRVITAQL